MVGTGYFCTVSFQRLTIAEFLLKSANRIVLDVRSPGEYIHAHIPNAVSFPLFTDEERKVVGTTYKQQSREQAIKVGLDFFGPKMRMMVEAVEDLVKKNQPASHEAKPEIFIHCWRGGMRSAAIAWLLDLYGFKVYTLAGGYKAFRNHVLQTFELQLPYKILGGYTGSGKTHVLNELEKNGELAVDLEQLASHRGSAFGSYNMPKQPSQEMFENKLALQLLSKAEILKSGNVDSDKGIWLEDESQRIGNVNIPSALWKTMRNSPVYFLEIPFEERLKYIVEDYGQCDPQKLVEAVQRISQRLGGLNTRNVLLHLEQNNLEEAFKILLNYYDKYYLKGLRNRENLSALLTSISCIKVGAQNAQLLLNKHQTA